jgi:hypothetical protein
MCFSQIPFNEFDYELYKYNKNPFRLTAEEDNVNKPSHYTSGGIETIDFIKAKLTPEQFEGFCLGNALKYLSRAGKKIDADEDKKKAEWYLTHLRTGSKILYKGCEEV